MADSSSKWRPGLGLAGALSVLWGNLGSDRHRDLPKANHCRGRWPTVFISFPTRQVPLTAPRTQRKTLPKRCAPSALAASPGRGTRRRGLRLRLSSPGGRPGDRALLPPPLVNTCLGPNVTGHLAGCWGREGLPGWGRAEAADGNVPPGTVRPRPEPVPRRAASTRPGSSASPPGGAPAARSPGTLSLQNTLAWCACLPAPCPPLTRGSLGALSLSWRRLLPEVAKWRPAAS